MKWKDLLCTCLLAVCAGPLNASMITLNASDSGWYIRNGPLNRAYYHDPNNENYIASSSNYRNFFVFDRSTVTGTIKSAKLRVDAGNVHVYFGTSQQYC